MINLRQILERAAIPPSLAETARLALAITGEDAPLSIDHGEGTPQSSKSFAKIYALRRSIGYFGKRKVTGLDETIALLNSTDRLVRLSYVQMENALIAIWLEEPSQSICGLLIIKSID